MTSAVLRWWPRLCLPSTEPLLARSTGLLFMLITTHRTWAGPAILLPVHSTYMLP